MRVMIAHVNEAMLRVSIVQTVIVLTAERTGWPLATGRHRV